MNQPSSLYDRAQHAACTEALVPKGSATNGAQTFGQRLARLRKAAGYTQRDLAAELGISYRMVAYYEAQTEHPPTALLPKLVELLNVSTDELLGISPSPKRPQQKLPTGRLWKRFKQLEQLPPKERREAIKLLDLFLDRERLKKAASSGSGR